MSKIEPDKINFNNNDFLVEIKEEGLKKPKKTAKPQQEEKLAVLKDREIDYKINEAELTLNRAKDEAQRIIDDANQKAQQILDETGFKAQEEKNRIIEEAKKEADDYSNTTKEEAAKEKEALISEAKELCEKERIEITKKGYEEGYQDGLEKIQEELEEKINSFDAFFKSEIELRDKILKSANRDILNLIFNITKKILFKEIDAVCIDNIIKNTITMFDKKENINIIVSEKYAKMLFELQKKSLADDIELNFEDFKQYDNFNITFNPDYDDDTIIIENPKERFDASINSQLDVIVRNVYDNTQRGKLDLEQYIKEDETE